MKLKHKEDVKVDDAVFYDGDFRTVCTKDIKYSEFLGVTIFGDSYTLGTKLVQVLSN